MKQTWIVLSLLILALTACSASTPTEEADTVQAATAVAETVSPTPTAVADAVTPEVSVTLSADYANAVPVEMQLLVGILKLEDTDLALTVSQAKSLLPLLTFLQDLSTNDSATQEQMNELIAQAQPMLSDAQIAAIANMQITQETALTLMREQGLEMGGPQSGNGNPPPQGEMPQGTPPAGGPGGQPPEAGSMGTPPANGMQPGGNFFPPQLLEMLIELAEERAAS